MRLRLHLTPVLAVAALALASCSGGGSVPSPQRDSSTTQSVSTSSNDASMPSPPYELIEAPLPHSNLRDTARRTLANAVSTVPVWSDSFAFGGSVFPYTMVGTSPFAAAATTVVPAEIQPLNFVFSNGTFINGAVPAAALAASPVFHSAVFPSETGQFMDVMQRASFRSVIGANYHVRFGTPTVLPALTIAVPSKFGKVGLFSNRTIGLVNFNFMFNVLQNVLAFRNFDTTTLPILITGNVFEYIPPARDRSHCCIGGFHFAQLQGANGIITYAFGAYNSPGIFRGGVEDITIASHEVAEWANDPLIGNTVPPWGFPTNPSVCVNNLLEVGDPIEVLAPSSYPVTLNGTVYHPQDIALFSWFAHQVPSIGLNGQYSYLAPEKLTAPPPACQ